jgi:hypothetical protein
VQRRLAVSWFAALLSWASAGAAQPVTPASSSRRLLERVEAELARGKPEEAERRLARALLHGLSEPQVWLRYAELNAPCLPTHAPAVSSRTIRLAERVWSQFAQMQTELDPADDALRRVRLHWSVVLANARHWEASLERASAAGRRQDPVSVACLRQIAVLAVRTDELAHAEAALTLARAYMPQELTLAGELGLVLLARGDAATALGPLSERFAAAPRDLGARRDLSYALAAAGRAPEGHELLAREAVVCAEDAGCLLELARLALEAKAGAAALEHAAALVHKAPQNLDAWFVLAEAQTVASDLHAARQSYEHILELSPQQPRARAALEALQTAPTVPATQ